MSELRGYIREALLFLGDKAPACEECCYQWQRASEVLEAALESEPEQEPVAWIGDAVNYGKGTYTEKLYFDKPLTSVINVRPLYTHPMRELTDDEILAICKNGYTYMAWNGDSNLVKFARAVIAAAKEGER